MLDLVLTTTLVSMPDQQTVQSGRSRPEPLGGTLFPEIDLRDHEMSCADATAQAFDRVPLAEDDNGVCRVQVSRIRAPEVMQRPKLMQSEGPSGRGPGGSATIYQFPPV